jgi:hypothetical protein
VVGISNHPLLSARETMIQTEEHRGSKLYSGRTEKMV